MAARARIRFSTVGASRVTGAFGKIGQAAGKSGAGISTAFSKIMYNVAKVSMLTAGLQEMRNSLTGATVDTRKFRDGSITALSAVSKKVAELRRKYYFFKLAAQKIIEPFVWAARLGRGRGEDTTTPEGDSGGSSRRSEILHRDFSQVNDAGRRREILHRDFSPRTTAATTAWGRFIAAIRGGTGVLGGTAIAITSLLKPLAALAIALGIIATAGGVAFVVLGYKTAKFAKNMVVDFMNIRETFRQYEISLGGVIQNTYALGKIMKFATQYASEYPAMFEEVLDTFRSLAALPSLKPMFRKADAKDLKEIMHIIQGLATLDPIQGVKGAGIALREALSGDMRSIRRRFEISARSIAEAGGYTLQEITQNSEKALKAFGAFIELNVPAKSMADAAQLIGIQFGNLRDKYRSFVNEIMKSTGAYWSVVTALMDLNDWLKVVFASDTVKKWSASLGNHIRAVVEVIKTSLSGIDWKKYIEEGDLVSGFIEAAKQISAVIKAVADEWGKPFAEAVSAISKILFAGLLPVIKILLKTMFDLFAEGAKVTGTFFAKSLGYWFIGRFTGQSSSEMEKSVDDVMARMQNRIIEKAAGLKFTTGEDGKTTVKKTGTDRVSKLAAWLGHKKKKPEEIEDLETPSALGKTGGLVKAAKDTKEEFNKAIDELVADYRKKIKELGKVSKPEIITPNVAIAEQEWWIGNLNKRLAASKKNNESLLKQKAILKSMVKAQEKLDMSRRRKTFEEDPNKGVLYEAKTKEEASMQETLEKSRKEGTVLPDTFYDALYAIKQMISELDKLYDKEVEQLNPAKDLAELIKSTTTSMKEWGEEYKISQKGAGGLLLIINKIKDVLSQKAQLPDKEAIETLLKERIKLTEEGIKKEKDYKKEIEKSTKSIAEKFVSLSTNLASSVTSFFGKYGKRIRKSTSVDKSRTMVPGNMFGTGMPGMSYGKGTARNYGSRTPKFLDHMLTGINRAMGGRGVGKTPEGKLALSALKLDLLGQKFDKATKAERPQILNDLMAAQIDNMKKTIAATVASAQIQKDIRDNSKSQLDELKLILLSSKEVNESLKNIKIPSSTGTPNNLAGANPLLAPAFG